ncbi:alpha/beta fold hydrolase [Salinimicrobium oceani]|uniref:Alpha/beta hydrolase n=1 Tax=Salinimicrobium oceani TaxID=2722702 RepID=A0ABX1CZW1_9FLAO|nr:alpha/beta hydrolase [Salinimicrobium oceani]NJW52919.1 alpha/beta hydrolase [Salinimicrobium oceani]
MTLNFQGAEIHYSVVGEGEATVLLHGFLESSKIWEEFLPQFSEHGKIITLDLPGHGRSGCVSDIHSMELMAAAVFEVLSSLGVKKANFIGHSMGGYVSLAFIEAHPKMVSALMLLNSTPQPDTEEKKEIRDRSIALVEKNKEAYVSMAIRNLLSPSNTKRFSEEIEALIQEAFQFPTEGITAALKGMKIRTNRAEVLRQFEGKKLLVAGEDDPLVNLQDLKEIAALCNCGFISFKGGHLSYLENKSEFQKLCISSKK